MNNLESFDFSLSRMDGQNIDESNSAINISDVIEVIETDCAATAAAVAGSSSLMNQPSAAVRRSSDTTPAASVVCNMPYIKIVEQPASKALRFRYECEGRSAGSIPGVNSTPENKTYPTIQIVGYRGKAIVVVSCVTKDNPYRPHPHNLVGKESCKKGICTVEINNETMTAAFANLGIQCVKKKDIEEALRIREDIRVDPFRTGFSHKTQTSSIDLNAVRLCFQAFLEGPQRGKFTTPLQPVVSEPIYDKKAMADLVICKLSHCSGSVAGGNEIILLCEKVAKEDISVRFYEEKDGQVVWESLGDFTPTQVHKQVAISFRTPRYKTLDIDQPVQALIQLRRPSDNATSEALPFQITPLDSDPAKLKRKRTKLNNEAEMRDLQESPQMRIGLMDATGSLTVKREPETSPNPYGLYGGGTMIMKQSPIFIPRTPSPLEYVAGPGGAATAAGAIGNAVGGTGSAAGGYYSVQPSQSATSMVAAVAHHQMGNYSPIYVQSPYGAGGGGGHSPGVAVLSPITPVAAAISPQPSPLQPTTELLDMDRHQISFEYGSAELADLGAAIDASSLSANLSANLILNDVASNQIRPNDNNNMTDSLTRLTNSAINELLDDYYKSNQNT